MPGMQEGGRLSASSRASTGCSHQSAAPHLSRYRNSRRNPSARILYRETYPSRPCEANCGYCQLNCPNCNSYSILQERNLGGKVEHVWVVIDSTNKREISKLNSGNKNSLGWDFSEISEGKLNYKDVRVDSGHASISMNTENLKIDIPEEETDENSDCIHSEGISEATAPPLSKTASQESGLYDLTQGKPEKFQHSIASRLTSSFQQHRQIHNNENSSKHLNMADNISVKSAQTAEVEIKADDNVSSNDEIADQPPTNEESEDLKRSNSGESERNNEVHSTNPFDDNYSEEHVMAAEEERKRSQSSTPVAAGKNPFDDNSDNDSDINVESGSIVSKHERTPSTRPCSTILSAKKLLKSNKVDVLIDGGKETTLCFAPPTSNRLGRYSNILASDACPADIEAEEEEVNGRAQLTILLTQIAVGIAIVVMSSALVMFFGALIKSIALKK